MLRFIQLIWVRYIDYVIYSLKSNNLVIEEALIIIHKKKVLFDWLGVTGKAFRRSEKMILYDETSKYDNISVDEDWNEGKDREKLMHTIHAYPAKFPAFIASKAFEYAKDEGVEIKKVADVFCGCGTVALEAKLHEFDFWGCDINPVATLIAKAKSNNYSKIKLNDLYNLVNEAYYNINLSEDLYLKANDRLKYWYTEKSYCDLFKLLSAINENVSMDIYLEAFQCIFSSILKSTSRWLTKSIKPQIDPDKKEYDVKKAFDSQYKKFLRGVVEMEEKNTSTVICCDNFLAIEDVPNVDLIISSPPYVTSYEYADLHQLSSLWLEFTDDYRDLRKGSIGSIYNSDDFLLDLDNLNKTGKEIVERLIKEGKINSKVKSVARYYADMQNVVEKCTDMLNKDGMIFLVVGDTEYKGVHIKNSEHLIECLVENGFSDIKLGKRTISKGLCVPYRDAAGKFSKDKTKRKVYHEEFIISGRMRYA